MIIGRYRFILLCLSLHAFPVLQAYDIPGFTPDQIIEYKQTVNSGGGAIGLDLHVFNPDGHQASDQRPAIVFFFGGGWVSGSASHFHPHCEFLASRGMVAISAEYRVKNLHGTTPQECVMDGKSAIRWIRENAGTLGIDPARIAAGGGSAGGHVAAAAGTLTAYEEPGENLAISSKPDALVLYNPVFDNGPGGYGHSTVQAYWEGFSPMNNIDATAPPTTVFLGTNDALIPVATAENYKALMEAAGRRCDLHLYEGQPHSFFNYDVIGDSSGPFYGYMDTLFKTDEFLVSLGYLTNPHEAPNPAENWVTIFGDAGFSSGSQATASPVTTDADADGIATNITPTGLEDGEFIRLTGSVTLDAPLSGSNFRIGLFDGDDPVTAGDGTGYVGIWAEAPATANTNIAAGNGTGSNHPFETPTAVILGPMPAADATVPANTPIEFTLMIARNGNNLDVSANFTNNSSYHQSQNLINQTVANYDFDSIAFLMTGNLNATLGSYSNIEIGTGTVLPVPETGGETGGSINRVITYVDAVEGAAGNTFATGGALETTTWVGPDTSSTNNTQWNKRTAVGGNGSSIFQGMPNGSPSSIPELTTQITGLADGNYDVWVFYWDQVDNDTQNWVMAAGLTSGSLTTYSSPEEPAVSGATTVGVSNAADLNFTTSVTVVDGGGLRNLFGINLGQVTVSGGSIVNAHVDMLLNGSGGSRRAWYDGVGYALVKDFSTWISDFSVGGQTGFTDDPDGDGNASGLENFFGSDPSMPDAAGLSAGEFIGNTFTFTHPQNATPADDLNAAYQWSIDLDTFVDDGASNGAGTTVTFSALAETPSPGITTVTATISGPASPDRLFVRMGVTQITP